MMKKEKLDIIYEDKFIIVVNKKSGLLTISTEKERENTLYHQVSEYVKKQNKNNKIFIVHRLDKDTSGLILFAKSEAIKHRLQDNWLDTKRLYLAIVNGKLKKASGTIKSYLKETKTHLVYVTNDPKGQLAITNYNLLDSNNLYSLLQINITTGRKNQIRAQLDSIGNPILGDKKYNKNAKKFNRLYLHAYYLEINHPVTNKRIEFVTDYPKDFQKYFKNIKKIY